MVSQVLQESQHVCRVVFGDQRTGDRVVRNRIAGQQHDSMSKMDLVNAKRTGELLSDLTAKLSAVKLPDRVFQAVVEKAGGKFEQEVTLEGLLDSVRIEFVAQDSIQDSLTNFVIISGLG